MNATLQYSAAGEGLYSPDLGNYQAYCLSVEVKDSQQWKQAGIIHDVTTNPHLAWKMAEQFTACQLASVHFRDAIEDMLP